MIVDIKKKLKSYLWESIADIEVNESRHFVKYSCSSLHCCRRCCSGYHCGVSIFLRIQS